MSFRPDDPNGSTLVEDLAGMAALILLLFVGLHIPLLA